MSDRATYTRLACVLALFAALAAACAVALQVRSTTVSVRCKGMLISLYQQVRRSDAFVNDPQWCQSHHWRCPACRAAYVYRAPQVPLRADVPGARLRPVAWCPTACHGGARNLLPEDGAVIELGEKKSRIVIEAGYDGGPQGQD